MVARTVPPHGIVATVGGRGQERREELLPLDEVDELGRPAGPHLLGDELVFALPLEEVDGRAQQPPRRLVEILRGSGSRVEKEAIDVGHGHRYRSSRGSLGGS